MRNLTTLTLALTLALPNAHANDGKASKEEKLLKMECRNGRWKITYAKNEEIVKITQADKMQGQQCYNQGTGEKKP